MGINLNPYLNWRGQAREAMEFYQSVLGGEPERHDLRRHGRPRAGDRREGRRDSTGSCTRR
ncbi:hypothetical protein [Nocardioides convexus]|uniref:hypothetical protein n=1 Tax=Nocardioides convexus TaxID=2712224 RepID=UPI002418B890|nr:hypothetical protein [Nocardioides convexus]